MVVRMATCGPHQGQRFWGCTQFPQGCRGILPYDEGDSGSEVITEGRGIPPHDEDEGISVDTVKQMVLRMLDVAGPD